MNATVEDLLQAIGELTVEGRLLRSQVSALSAKLTEQAEELAKEKAKNADKEDKDTKKEK